MQNMNSSSLYTTTDVAKVRKILLSKQKNLDALTGLEIPEGQAVLDHCHKSQFARAVLHRQCNAVLGKLENLHGRYLAWWYPDSLAEFLRKAADYLDAEHPEEYVHPGWLKKVKTEFNKLKVKQQDFVLEEMKSFCLHSAPKATNSVSRKKLFSTLLLKKKYSYDTITALFNKSKENNETS